MGATAKAATFIFLQHWCFPEIFLTSVVLNGGGGVTGTRNLLRNLSTVVSDIIALRIVVGLVFSSLSVDS